jgi:hypothetical protein
MKRKRFLTWIMRGSRGGVDKVNARYDNGKRAIIIFYLNISK